MKTILVDAVHTFILPNEGMDQELYELLETYPNKKIILTGATEEQMQIHKMIDLPYPVFTLNHDPEKTDPTYYQKMLEEFGLSAEEVIYFEHDREATQTARSVGIKTYRYDENERDLGALKGFLDTAL